MDDLNTTHLSPAAYAVVKAAHKADYASRPGIAAALRAAALQLTSARAIDTLRAIAAELEGGA